MVRMKWIALVVAAGLCSLYYLCTSNVPSDLSSPENAQSMILLSSPTTGIVDSGIVDSVGKKIGITVPLILGYFIDSVSIAIYGEKPLDGVSIPPDTQFVIRFNETDVRDTLRFAIVFTKPGTKYFVVTTFKKLDYTSSAKATAIILGVDEKNNPPVFLENNPPSVVRMKIGETCNIPVNATDVNDDPLKLDFSRTITPSASTPLPRIETAVLANNIFNWKAEPGDKGVYPVLFIVSDGHSVITTTTIIAVDSSYNSPPKITSVAPLTAQAEVLYQYQPVAVDEEKNDIRWALEGSRPSGMQFDPATGRILWVPDRTMSQSGKLVLKAIDDGKPEGSDEQIIQIAVNGVNHAPVALSSNVATGAETPIDIRLYADDRDGDTLTYVVVRQPPFGVTVAKNDSMLTYTPAAKFMGVDTIWFVAHDKLVSSDTAKILVYVAFENQRPVAKAQQISVLEDEAVSVPLAATDVENSPLIFSLRTPPRNGKIKIESGSWIYMPNPNFNGVDTFTYVANDGQLDSDPAKIIVFILPVNDIPEARNLGVSVKTDTPITVSLVVVDPDDSVFTFEILTEPRHGSAEKVGALAIRYIPAPGFNGTDSIVYIVKDASNGISKPARLTLAVGMQSVKPVAVSQNVDIMEDSACTFALTGNGAEGKVLSFAVSVFPVHGKIVGSGASLTYRPNPDFSGTDSLLFICNDGLLDSDPARVLFNVKGVNDLPVASSESYVTSLNAPVTLSMKAQDVDDSVFTFKITRKPLYGTLDTTDLKNGKIRYIPNNNSKDADAIRYVAIDMAGGQSNEAILSITVVAVNQRPVADPQWVEINEDATKPIFLTGKDETPSQNLIYSITQYPKHGSFEGNFPTISYKTDRDFNGPDTFWFKVSDGSLESDPARVAITILPINDPPVLTALPPISIAPNTNANIALQAHDVDDVNLTYQMVDPPLNGTVDLANLGSGRVLYKPATGFTGTDSMGFRVFDDDMAGSTTVYIKINVSLNNQPPVAIADTVNLNEDDSLPVTLVGRDDFTAVDKLKYAISTFPAHGTLKSVVGQVVWYKPALNYNGNDELRFTVSDGMFTSNPAQILIVIKPVNDPPVGIPQTVAVPLNDSMTVTLTADDPDGLTGLVFRVTNMPANGLLDTVNVKSGKVRYKPSLNFKGKDTLLFVVKDPTGLESAAERIILEVSGNAPPVAQPLVINATEDITETVTLTGTDLENAALTYAIDVQPKKGTVSGGSGAVRTYLANKDYNGIDSFYYHVNDGVNISAQAKVRIIIAPVNDPPVAKNVTLINVPEDTDYPLTFDSSDPDGDLVTAFPGNPMHGTVAALPTGGYFYRSTLDYNGPDSFSYYVKDSVLTSNTAMVRITITPVNDAPTADPQDGITTEEDKAIDITLSGSDPENDPLTFNVAQAAHGAVTILGKTAHYIPNDNYNGTDSFSFIANDGKLSSAAANVKVLVTPVNDAPKVLSFPEWITDLGKPFADIPLDDYVTDVDNTKAEISWSADPDSHFTVMMTGGRKAKITVKNSTWTGSGTITFKAVDPSNASDAGTVKCTVKNGNNTIPTISTIADKLVNVNTATGTISFTVDDQETLPAQLAVTATTDNATLVGSAGIVLGGQDKNRTISITPTQDAHGVATVTVHVSDGSAFAESSFKLTVNALPEAHNLSATVAPDGNRNHSFTAAEVGTDIDGTIASCEFLLESGDSTTAYGKVVWNPSGIKYTQNQSLPGTNYPYTDIIQYRLKDNNGGMSTTAVITITIQP